MGAGDSKPTSASSSEQQQQIHLQQQKQKQNRPIDVAEAMRVGDKSKDVGGLHPRGHGAMGKQPLNSNALNSGNETTLSSTRDPKSPKMMGSGQKSPRPIAGTSSLVVQNGRKEKEIDFPALTLRQGQIDGRTRGRFVRSSHDFSGYCVRRPHIGDVSSGFGTEHVHFRFRCDDISVSDDCHDWHGEQKYGREGRERISDGHLRRTHYCDCYGCVSGFWYDCLRGAAFRSHANATSRHATGGDVFKNESFHDAVFFNNARWYGDVSSDKEIHNRR